MYPLTVKSDKMKIAKSLPLIVFFSVKAVKSFHKAFTFFGTETNIKMIEFLSLKYFP